MENNNKYIAVSYQLHTIDGDKVQLAEIATDKDPFIFVSGFGITLKDFEKEIVGLQKGDKFDFTLTPEQAYGEFYAERVIDLDKEMFNVDGRFDKERIYIDAIIPLQN
ncbi:MAG: FKBP-type peptidyl-prolyl cis-trans isomerase, partial [Prevotella sp.]|nr:FKBP-type peptidyl-prolyl cis-trans isomerase [Prevotella sp.]